MSIIFVSELANKNVKRSKLQFLYFFFKRAQISLQSSFHNPVCVSASGFDVQLPAMPPVGCGLWGIGFNRARMSSLLVFIMDSYIKPWFRLVLRPLDTRKDALMPAFTPL